MARAVPTWYGQSQYGEQLVQSVIIPTVTTSGNVYKFGTNVSTTTITVDTICANTLNANNITFGNINTNVLAIGRGSLQGTYGANTDNTIVGVYAVGTTPANRGTFQSNVIIGSRAGLNLSNMTKSVYIGADVGQYGNGGSNVIIGYNTATGYAGTTTTKNVFLGAGAGYSNQGSSNIFIGADSGGGSDLSMVSNTLIIHNVSNSATPLIHGQLNTGRLCINTKPVPGDDIYALRVGGPTRFVGDSLVDGTLYSRDFVAMSNITAGTLTAVTVSAALRNANNIYNQFGGVNVSNGNVSAAKFFGDGSSLTGLGVSGGSNGTYGGVILDASSIVASGVSNNISAGYFGGANISSGIVSAVKFFGDGSSLSGISTSVSGGSNGTYGGVSMLSGVISTSVSGNNISDGFFGGLNISSGRIGDGFFGGVRLSNNTVTSESSANSFTGGTFGGVAMSLNNINATGTSNRIGNGIFGNVTLSNGGIFGSGLASNNIGGISLSGGVIYTQTPFGSFQNIGNGFFGGAEIQYGKIIAGGGGTIGGVTFSQGIVNTTPVTVNVLNASRSLLGLSGTNYVFMPNISTSIEIKPGTYWFDIQQYWFIQSISTSYTLTAQRVKKESFLYVSPVNKMISFNSFWVHDPDFNTIQNVSGALPGGLKGQILHSDASGIQNINTINISKGQSGNPRLNVILDPLYAESYNNIPANISFNYLVQYTKVG